MLSAFSFRRQLVVLMLCIALLCTGCSQTAAVSSTDTTEEITTGTSGDTSSSDHSDFELDDNYDADSAATITLDGDTASSNGTGVSIADGVVTITKAGTYLISGTLDDGQIVVNADKTEKVWLVLDNASISCSDSSPILVRQADKVKVTLAPDSQNTLSDGETYLEDEDNPDAALFSKDDLVVNGSGSLTVNGNYKHGIAGYDDLVITGGTFDITSKSHALRGKDSVSILDGTFTLTSEKDGIQASNTEDSTKGWVKIDGGSFVIRCSGDGIQAETDLTVNGGSFDIISGGGAENGPEHTTATIGGMGGMGGGRHNFDPSTMDSTTPPDGTASADGTDATRPTPPDGTESEMGQPPEMTIGESGDTTFDLSIFVDPDDFDDASTEDSDTTVSTKGIKAGNALTINDGDFTIDSADDSLHSNYSINITNGSFALSSGDDGIHADAYLTIDGGTIDISECYEGLEAAQLTINGGTITLVASDDGLNAAGGGEYELTEDGLVLKTAETTTSTEAADTPAKGGGGGGGMMAEDNCDIFINGGTLIVDANGDGLDSNGNITVTGGTVLVFGPTSGADSAIDCDGESSISSGTIAAFGSSSMAQGLDSSGDQSVLMVTWNETQSAQTRISLCDENGQILFSVEPQKDFQSAVISTSGMTSGMTLGLYTGGTTSSDSQIITMGELTDATKLCDVTLADEMTSISSDGSERAQMGMGGMGGGKGNRGDVTPPDGATPPERPANDGTAPEGTPSGGTSADS